MSSMDAAVSSLVKRLETVTARLEAVEKQIASGAAASSAPAAAASSAGGDGSESASVAEYTDLINTHIVPLVSITAKIGSDELKKQVDVLQKAVEAQKEFLKVAASCKKPSSAEAVAKLVQATSTLMGEIGAIRDQNRKSKQFNHLSTLSEGISCLGWVMVEPTPGPFVNEARGSSEFYSNKILVEFKKTDQDQVAWVNAWNTFMKDLFTFIKKHHTTGLTWNPRGGDASEFKGSASAPAAAPAKGGPPPPPPAPKAPLTSASDDSKPAGPNPANLFAEINKGGAITSGLKKVTKDMKKKYDPNQSSVITETEKKPAASAATKTAAQKKGTPKIELSGNKWIIEWQENNNNIEITETELKQTIYIYKCTRSVVRIKGKVNSVSLDGCTRTSVVFDDALALCEMVNCNSVEIQCLGRVPSVAIDKCSGVQFYVSKDGLETEFVSSKSDQMNILIPDPNGGVDPVEMAVPEQFKTVIKNHKLVTGTVEHV